jgi:hypothetical protein
MNGDKTTKLTELSVAPWESLFVSSRLLEEYP